MSYPLPEEMARKEGKSYFLYEGFELLERVEQCNLPPSEFPLSVAGVAPGLDTDELRLGRVNLVVAGHMARELPLNSSNWTIICDCFGTDGALKDFLDRVSWIESAIEKENVTL